MKKLFCILLFCALAAIPAFGTGWTVIQQTNSATSSTCGATNLTCAEGITSTGSTDEALALLWNCGSPTLQNQCSLVTAQTYNGGVNTITHTCTGSVIDTVTLPPTGQIWQGATNAAVGYSLTSGGGADCLQLTRSTAASDTWGFSFFEFSYPASVTLASVDGLGTAAISSPTTSYSGVPLYLSGANDIYFQMFSGNTAIGVTPSVWATNEFTQSGSHFNNSYLLNVNGSAPVPAWASSTPLPGVVAAIAFSYVTSLVGQTTGVLANGGVKMNGGIVLNPPVSTVAITSTSPLPNCTIGIPYSFTFAATGGVSPYTWSQPSGTLQPGLTLSPSGVLSGSCTNSSGTETFGIEACDSEATPACVTASFQQTAQNTPAPGLVVCDSTVTLQNSGVVSTSGTAVTWVSGNNFNNLQPTQVITINSVNYVIASIGSSTSLTLTATAGTQTSVSYSTNYPTCPNPPTPLVTGSFYAYTFNAIGGTAPYTWTIQSGSIPLGQTLTTAGVLSGFPATNATYAYTVLVTDSSSPTPETAIAAFTEIVVGATGTPQTAVEPQNWVTIHQGGVNATTGNPCQPTDTNCTYSLPKTCNAANHCVHEQLGFGSNDYPATLAGLNSAGCDWASELTSTAALQNWYLWVEVKNGSLLSSGILDSTNTAMWNAPVKIQGWQPVFYGSTPVCPHSPTNTPIGVWSIAGSVTSGNFQLGEVIQQQTTLAEANLYFYGCQSSGGPAVDVPPVYPRPCVNGVVAGATGVTQVGPIQIGPIVNGTADGTHTWIGQTSGAVFTPSAVPAANGFFRMTGQCSPGAGSGKNGTFGGTNDTPCNNLANQIPCFHSILDSAIVNVSPTGANSNNCYNDLPSMFTFALAAWSGTVTPTVIQQMGNNTSLSGFEVTITPGIVQEMDDNGPCAAYSTVNCDGSPTLISVDCIACFQDHFFGHGWDPGDPAPYSGWGLSQEQIGINAGYPVNPTDGHHECPSWSYYSTYPGGTNLNGSGQLNPITLTGSNLPYDSGCGEKLDQGVTVRSGGFTASEYFAITKTHEFQDESHVYSIGHGADNLNPVPAGVVPGQINTGGNGMQGPHKMAQFLLRCTAECWFSGGSAINPNNGVLTDVEVRSFRTGSDPGYRFLTGNSGHSPQATVPQVPNSQGYGCGQGPLYQTKSAQICPFAWAMKKAFEEKYCLRCTIDGFLGENMWPDGQTGEIFAMDARVCSGGTVCSIVGPTGVPLTQSNDIRFTNGIVRNASGVWSISPRALGPGNGGGISAGENRNLIQNVLAYNTDNQQFGGSNLGDVILYGSAGNTYPNCTASISGGVESVTCPNPPYNVSGLTGIVLDNPTNPSCPGAANSATVCFIGRQDVLNGGTAQFSLASSQCTGGGPYPAICTDTNYAAIVATGIDCRTMSAGVCTTSGVAAGFYAPTCNAGVYSNSAQIGTACSNCGSGGASQCPAFGRTSVAAGNSPYSNDIACGGEGNGSTGCGPANLSIQSVAFNLLDISPGDIAYVTNCTPGSFNVPPGGVPPPSGQNVYASNTTNPATLTVSFPAPSGASGTAVNCQANNASGFQKNFIVNHFALYTGGIAHIGGSHGYTPQMLNNALINSIMYFGTNGNGIYCSSGACSGLEANKGAYKMWDQQSNQIHHDVFVLPTTARAALYSAVFGAGGAGSPFCPSTAGVNGGGNCVPATVGCATNQTADGNGNPICLGLTGFLNGIGYGSGLFPSGDCTSGTIYTCPLVSPPWGTFDYHNLALCTGCSYVDGLFNINFFGHIATDGGGVGPCIGSLDSTFCPPRAGANPYVPIDTALTRTIYVCYGSCGLGPWPD